MSDLAPRRPRVAFAGRIPVCAAGVRLGEITPELLEAVIRLAEDGPRHADGAPLSAEELLDRVRRRLEA